MISTTTISSKRAAGSATKPGSMLAGLALTIMILSIASSAFAFINVTDYGAKGDGSDQTAALQAALNAAAVNGGDTVYLPAGLYTVSSTLVVSNVRGLRIIGDGVWVSQISPTAALTGKPVIQFINCVDDTIQNLSVLGFSGNPPPSSAIEVDSAPGGQSTHLTLRNVTLGSLSSNSMVDGITFVQENGATSSTTLGFFDNVTIANFTHAGYSFTDPGSMDDTIVGGDIANGPIGIYSQGGTFKVLETHFDVNGIDLDLENPTSANQGYQGVIMASDVSSEGTSQMLQTGTAPMMVSMNAMDHKFSPANTPLINFESSGMLTLSNSHMLMLGTGASVAFTGGSSQIVNLRNNYFNLSSVNLNGHLYSDGNCWQNNPAVSEVPGSTILETADVCGTFGRAARRAVIARR